MQARLLELVLYGKRGEVTVFEAETNGVLEAIRWIMELNIFNVDIESDSMLTVKAFAGGSSNVLEVGNMIREGRALLNDRTDSSLSYVNKRANKVAHLLARVPCEVGCFNDFLSPLHMVLETLVYDASLN